MMEVDQDLSLPYSSAANGPVSAANGAERYVIAANGPEPY